MLKCTSCGNAVDDDDRFCKHCGDEFDNGILHDSNEVQLEDFQALANALPVSALATRLTESTPVSGREHRTLRKLHSYKEMCQALEKQGFSRDEARSRSRLLIVRDPVSRAVLSSGGLYYLAEQTGVADGAYLRSLTNELVELYTSAPDFVLTSDGIREAARFHMKNDGVEFASGDDAEQILDSIVDHVIVRNPL